MGASCAAFNASVVILAALLTAAVVGGMVVFTLQTKVMRYLETNKHANSEDSPHVRSSQDVIESVINPCSSLWPQFDLTSLSGTLFSLLWTLLLAGVLQVRGRMIKMELHIYPLFELSFF